MLFVHTNGSIYLKHDKVTGGLRGTHLGTKPFETVLCMFQITLSCFKCSEHEVLHPVSYFSAYHA